jgi:hypothetical protein
VLKENTLVRSIWTNITGFILKILTSVRKHMQNSSQHGIPYHFLAGTSEETKPSQARPSPETVLEKVSPKSLPSFKRFPKACCLVLSRSLDREKLSKRDQGRSLLHHLKKYLRRRLKHRPRVIFILHSLNPFPLVLSKKGLIEILGPRVFCVVLGLRESRTDRQNR